MLHAPADAPVTLDVGEAATVVDVMTGESLGADEIRLQLKRRDARAKR
jgi:hypothetical protein